MVMHQCGSEVRRGMICALPGMPCNTPRIPLRKRVKWALAHKKAPRTAQWIKSHPNVEPHAGIGTVSSLLKKMVDDGDLVGTDNYGPRGGRGYKLAKKKR